MAAQLSLGERVVDDLERRLLAACGTTKAKFQSAVNDAPRYDFDQYTSPYISTPEEKQMTTNILRIVTKTTDNAKLAPLTTDFLEANISLEPPKKVVAYTGRDIATEKGAGRARGARNTNRVRNDDILQPSSLLLGASEPLLRKSSSLSTLLSVPIVSAPAHVDTSARLSSRASSGSLSTTVTNAANLYVVIESVFNEYWNMTFEVDEVNAAFFALIHVMNAHEFHLPTFAAESTSLTVIHKRIAERRYTNIDGFKFDMETMFRNILKYYPEGSPAYVMAQQLYGQFTAQWPKVLERLR